MASTGRSNTKEEVVVTDTSWVVFTSSSCNWVDVKPAEGIQKEEGTRKIVVNYPGGQVITPKQS